MAASEASINEGFWVGLWAPQGAQLLSTALLIAVLGLAGSTAPLAPGPSFITAAVALVLLGTADLGRRRKVAGMPSEGRAMDALRLERRLLRVAFGGALFVVVGYRAETRLAVFEAVHGALAASFQGPERCAARVVVSSSPTLRSAEKAAEGAASRAVEGAVLTYVAVAKSLSCQSFEWAQPVVVRLLDEPRELARGDELEIIATLAPLQLLRNFGLLDPTAPATRRGAVLSGSIVHAELVLRGSGLSSSIDRARAHVRERIVATYHPLSTPLARALVLGEMDLPSSDAQAFAKSGLMHVLAVSGTHLVIAVLSLTQALRALLVRTRFARRYDVARGASVLGVGLGLLYADFAGASGSAQRAAFMLCFVLGGRALGKKVSGRLALCASILLGLGVDPLLGSDLSFLLSALATFGLLALGQPLSRLCVRGRLAQQPFAFLIASVLATLSSSLPCAPVLALFSGEMTWAALPANVIAGPLGELLALPSCLAHTLTAFFPSLERGLALVGSGALLLVRETALWSAEASWGRFQVPNPSAWALAQAVLGVLLGAAWWRGPLVQWVIGGRRARALGVLCVALACVAVEGWSGRAVGRELASGGRGVRSAAGASGASTGRAGVSEPARRTGPRPLVVTALDVGQGDALLVEYPDGKKALVDGGGTPMGRPDLGELVLLPYFRARGLEHIDFVVLTHPDRDHLLGLEAVVRELSVSELWYPGRAGERSFDLRRLLELARSRGVRVRTATELCGAPHDFGARVQVLSPCGAPDALGRNDASLVLRIQHGFRSVLLTGDVEHAGEAWLASAWGPALEADLLKVAHHGSRTSSTQIFLDQVRPRYAFISVGVRNAFDHPAAEVLERFASQGTQVFRTDQLGALRFETDGRKVEIRAFKNGAFSQAFQADRFVF